MDRWKKNRLRASFLREQNCRIVSVLHADAVLSSAPGQHAAMLVEKDSPVGEISVIQTPSHDGSASILLALGSDDDV